MSFLPPIVRRPAGRILVLALLAAAPSARAQDAAVASVASELLAVPEDGAAYYRDKERARALIQADRAAEAEPFAARLVRDYPRDGENWYLLGQALGAANRHAEAAEAFVTAGPIWRWGNPPVAYQAAIQYMLAGDTANALAQLRSEIFERRGLFRYQVYDWPAFAPLREDSSFRALTGRPLTTGWTRDDGWARDLEHLVAEVRRVNPAYERRELPAEFMRRYATLRERIPSLSDEQVFTGIAHMLASLRQGHIALFPPADERRLPFRFYTFPEGVFIVEAFEQAPALAGARVVAVDGAPVQEIMPRLATLRSVEGPMQHLWGTADLASTYRLKGLGIIRSRDTVTLTVEQPDGGRRSLRVATTTATPAIRADKLVAPPHVPAPLWLRDVQRFHWTDTLPELDALYVQLNQMVNAPDQTLEQFGERLHAQLESLRPANVILDLRHNNGGNPRYYQVLRALTAFTQRAGTQLYALIGRRTYSAAGMFISELERWSRPVFVGEASSECCNLDGDPARVVLPYSQVQGEVTAVIRPMSDPWDLREEMSPEAPVQLTAAAYFAGRDPVMDAVARMITGERSGAGAQR